MKTVSGLFDNYAEAKSAVKALESSGIPSDQISIVSCNADGRYENHSGAADGAGTGAGLGAVVGGAGGLLTGLGIMAIPGVGPVVAAGWLAAMAAGAVAGAVAGGAAGSLIVTAKIEDTAVSDAAEAILKRSNWVDLVERRNAYVAQGWTRFDDTLDPYSPEAIEQERNRYRQPGV
jgi:hypothetical protein